eukprot:m.221071 g.221071  ORF g.221071 m.221071 type:complete len:194 (+) comp15708_c0_seq1:49-630(+)
MTEIKQQPMPKTIDEAVPKMSDALNSLFDVPAASELKLLTTCLCASCGLNPSFQFACARKSYCLKCIEGKAACNCFSLVDAPYCVNSHACFCLKCIVCTNQSSCCAFPFPCDEERHCLCCNWAEQTTVCGGGGAGRTICCSNSNVFSCCNPVEKACFNFDRIFCLDCRLGCLPGDNEEIPFACTIFGAQLWAK